VSTDRNRSLFAVWPSNSGWVVASAYQDEEGFNWHLAYHTQEEMVRITGAWADAGYYSEAKPRRFVTDYVRGES